MGPPRCIAIPSAAWDIVVVVLDIGVHFRDPATVQHVADLWQTLMLVEHEAVVVGGVHGERRAVHGVDDVGVGQRPVAAARATRFPAPLVDPVAERPGHHIELVPDRRRDPRTGNQDHQDYDRDDQDVLDCRLSFQAVGKSTRYPPPKGISAARICGSSRIGFEFTRKRSPRLIRSVRNAAAALLLSPSHMPTHLHGSHHTSLRSCTATYLPNYTATELHAYRAIRLTS